MNYDDPIAGGPLRYSKAVDSINHPPHYNRGKIEVIDFIEDQDLGFHLGNVIKYICRPMKSLSRHNRIEDLKKAQWYLSRYISNMEKAQSERT